MSKKKIVITILSVALVCVILLCGCTVKNATFSVSTGDKITVHVDAFDGDTISKNDKLFELQDKQHNTVLTGMFIDATEYTEYFNAFSSGSMTMLEAQTGGDTTILSTHINADGKTVYEYVLWLTGSNTGVIIDGYDSQNSVKENFSQLSFEVKKTTQKDSSYVPQVPIDKLFD